MKGRKTKRDCDLCGKEGVRIQRTTRIFGKGKDLVVIEQIPMVRRPHCHESYYTADTLHEIDRLRLHRKSLAEKRSIGVIAFA
ncbi:MAG: YgiT-type zinc finger protein [Candidatus Sumerlaeota bacterium]|nr:YgiT-type zinc finger protein [Candidatus Sumerlaeota bacterium]